MSGERAVAFDGYDGSALSWSFVVTPENPMQYFSMDDVDFSVSMLGVTIHAHRAETCNRDVLKTELAKALQERDAALDNAGRYLAERNQARAELERVKSHPWEPLDESLEDW